MRRGAEVTTKLSRHSYERMIDEDLAWLMQQPRTLARDHIAGVLAASADHEYRGKVTQPDDLRTRCLKAGQPPVVAQGEQGNPPPLPGEIDRWQSSLGIWKAIDRHGGLWTWDGHRTWCGGGELNDHVRSRLAVEVVTLRARVDELTALVETADGCNGLDTDSRVRFYEHDFYPLSNFSAFQLAWCGRYFPTSEHAYQWEKFRFHDNDTAHAIRSAVSAHEAFKLAEQYRDSRDPQWDERKVSIMREILQAKLEQHEYVMRKLLATGDRELVEDSWRDDFWGWGPNRDGQNMLGRLWMEIRSDARKALLASGEKGHDNGQT